MTGPLQDRTKDKNTQQTVPMMLRPENIPDGGWKYAGEKGEDD